MDKNKKIKFVWQDWLIGGLLIVAMVIIPLIVSYEIVPASESELEVTRSTIDVGDIFSYRKSVWICIIATVMAICGFFVRMSRTVIRKINYKEPIIIYSVLYSLIVVLSTVFSSYKDVAGNGAAERYEGVWTILSYIVFMLCAYFFINVKNKVYVIIAGVFLSIAFVGGIGMFQYFGMDIFKTEFGAKIILGSYYNGTPLSIKFNAVYSTLYNPNCVGLYSSMLFCFCFVFTLLIPGTKKIFVKTGSKNECEEKWSFDIKKIIIKLISLMATVVIFFSLIGNHSAGGILGTGISLLVVFVSLIVYAVKNKKYRKISKRVCIFLCAAGLVCFVGAGFYIVQYTDLVKILFEKTESSINGEIQEKNREIVDLKSFENGIEVVLKDDALRIYIAENNFIISDLNGEKALERSLNDLKLEDYFTFDTKSIKSVEGVFVKDDGETFFAMSKGTFRIVLKVKENYVTVVDKKYNEIDLNSQASSFGFKGFESIGNGRGYIWSRTIPMMFNRGIKNTVLGSGPDTFSLEFPQYEIDDKLRYLDDSYVIVDKPHNIFLQMGVNTGFISLLLFIVILVIYFIGVLKSIFADNEKNKVLFAAKIAFMAAILAYLGTGLTTDSVVSVAPIFWILLGTGFALNRKTDYN